MVDAASRSFTHLLCWCWLWVISCYWLLIVNYYVFLGYRMLAIASCWALLAWQPRLTILINHFVDADRGLQGSASLVRIRILCTSLGLMSTLGYVPKSLVFALQQSAPKYLLLTFWRSNGDVSGCCGHGKNSKENVVGPQLRELQSHCNPCTLPFDVFFGNNRSIWSWLVVTNSHWLNSSLLFCLFVCWAGHQVSSHNPYVMVIFRSTSFFMGGNITLIWLVTWFMLLVGKSLLITSPLLIVY